MTEQEQHLQEEPQIPSHHSLQSKSTRFDSYNVPGPGGRMVRTEKDQPPRLLQPGKENILTTLLEHGKSLVNLRRQRQELHVQEQLARDFLTMYATLHSDFRGFEFPADQAILTVIPVTTFDPDRLQESLGVANYSSVVHDDFLTLRVKLDGHPEIRRILETNMRHLVKSTMRLTTDEEVAARVLVSRSASVRTDTLRHLLLATKQKLVKGTVRSREFRVSVRDVATPPPQIPLPPKEEFL